MNSGSSHQIRCTSNEKCINKLPTLSVTHTHTLSTSASLSTGLHDNLTFHYPSERQQGLVFVTIQTHGHNYPCYRSKKKSLGCLWEAERIKQEKAYSFYPFPKYSVSLADGFFRGILCSVRILDNIILDYKTMACWFQREERSDRYQISVPVRHLACWSWGCSSGSTWDPRPEQTGCGYGSLERDFILSFTIT